uniref:Putative ovule protein n=1 Tax=Solanum chacoense TaxID=4108 RepID=A0A0V0H324_SOLCH
MCRKCIRIMTRGTRLNRTAISSSFSTSIVQRRLQLLRPSFLIRHTPRVHHLTLLHTAANNRRRSGRRRRRRYRSLHHLAFTSIIRPGL